MHKEILSFWFDEIKPSQWWKKDSNFDQLIIDRFSTVHSQANHCELYTWRQTALGRLAEIIVLDQFSRNMFRGSPLSFASDALALALAQEAVTQGADMELDPQQRGFLYTPYMHSESADIHAYALSLYQERGTEGGFDFELKHKRIIDRFGRYPHRNIVLGRESTQEELDFLKEANSSF